MGLCHQQILVWGPLPLSRVSITPDETFSNRSRAFTCQTQAYKITRPSHVKSTAKRSYDPSPISSGKPISISYGGIPKKPTRFIKRHF